jgi:hypothetical protein
MADRLRVEEFDEPEATQRERVGTFMAYMATVGRSSDGYVVKAGVVRGTDGHYWNFDRGPSWHARHLERICGGLLVAKINGSDHQIIESTVHLPEESNIPCVPLVPYNCTANTSEVLGDGDDPTLPYLTRTLGLQGSLSPSLIQAAYLDLQINGHNMPQVDIGNY